MKPPYGDTPQSGRVRKDVQYGSVPAATTGPVQLQRPVTPLELASYPTSTSHSGAQAHTGLTSGPTSTRQGSIAVGQPGWPIGYVVASAIFLAIAFVGFSVWLALEVISF
jgi:hypothetical protein